MIKIKITDEDREIGKDKIRRQYNEKQDEWYFSVVDVIDIATKSTDARNYWKVLKNRLKTSQNKSQNELVTKCNQLKMLSRDGKYYLTDTADAKTMLQIIELVSPENTAHFSQWFDSEAAKSIPSSSLETPARLLVDGFETSTEIVLRVMIAGVSPSDLSISVTPSKITIKGKRYQPENTGKDTSKKYLIEELLWSDFFRTISLPSKVKTDSLKITEEVGLVTIKLEKL